MYKYVEWEVLFNSHYWDPRRHIPPSSSDLHSCSLNWCSLDPRKGCSRSSCSFPTSCWRSQTKRFPPVCAKDDRHIRHLFFHSADPQGITSREFQPSHDIFRRPGAKGCLDHRYRARTPSLHCPIANSASTQTKQPV